MPVVLDGAFGVTVVADLDRDVRVRVVVIEVSSFGCMIESDGDLFIVPGRGRGIGEGKGAEHRLIIIAKQGIENGLGILLEPFDIKIDFGADEVF